MLHIYSIIALFIGYILDLIVGDPYWMWHPIRFIGNLISLTEKILRKVFKQNEKSERIAGVFLVIIVVAVSTIIPMIILFIAYYINRYLGLAIESIMCYQLLATKALKDESMKVAKALKNDGLEAGRKAVSMIVGRDTQDLTEEGVIKAAVETVAENTADGIIAPMFYMAIGGAFMGFFYKAVNTMDSMVGYKNDKYLYFGRFAAKMDDLFNYIPARLSAFFMILSAFCLGMDGKGALRIYLRDRRKHASPNSAQTEAVCAGALGVQLAGDAYYFGKLYHKETIGDPVREIEAEDIVRAGRLMDRTAVLTLIVLGLLRIVVL